MSGNIANENQLAFSYKKLFNLLYTSNTELYFNFVDQFSVRKKAKVSETFRLQSLK